MKALKMFIPLTKADASERLVYGHFDETPDRANEVCDYVSAKKAFQLWSDELSKASGGKSLGNIRAQHDMKKAAGKLVELTFDDDARRISFCGKIVDDAEWLKVEEGVYTGFSPGGAYAKRWRDGTTIRYTPLVRELSIVDLPCNPNSFFTMVKADGGEEEVGFALAKAYEPGNEATKARAEEMAKAAGGDARAKDFVAMARADLIAENVAAELEKAAASTGAEDVDPPADDPDDPAAALSAALAKAGQATRDVPAIVNGEATGPFADLAKAAEALRLIRSPDEMLKGLWTVEWLSDLMSRFDSLQESLHWEANGEGDGSTVPAKAANIVRQIGELLVQLAQEEVAEVIALLPAGGAVEIADGDGMALAAEIVNLVKADTAVMEKIGARNSASDMTRIQVIHDHAVGLGAGCSDLEKVTSLSTQNERLTKAIAESVPQIESLAATVEELKKAVSAKGDELSAARADIEKLKAQPAAGKGVVFELPKGADALEKAADGEDAKQLTLDEIKKLPAADRMRELDAYAHRANQIPA